MSVSLSKTRRLCAAGLQGLLSADDSKKDYYDGDYQKNMYKAA
jgi:hypothetical protein